MYNFLFSTEHFILLQCTALTNSFTGEDSLIQAHCLQCCTLYNLHVSVMSSSSLRFRSFDSMSVKGVVF